MPPIELQFAWSNRALARAHNRVVVDEKKRDAAVQAANILLKGSLPLDDFISGLETFVRRLGRDGYIDVVKRPPNSYGTRVSREINDPEVSNAYASLLAKLCGYRALKTDAFTTVQNLPAEIRDLHTYKSRNNAMSFALSENAYRASATMRQRDDENQKAADEVRANSFLPPENL